MNPDVINIIPKKNHILQLIFAGGEIREFDMKPYLYMGIFREIRDETYFRKAFVEFGSVEWPHGQGLSYNTLYLKSKPVSLAL